MLYYIIPPIIIILSLGTLIFFLFKKVSQLPDGVVLIEEKPPVKWGRFSELLAILGHFGLKLLERLMQRMKLFSLKFHNASNDLFHSIRKKREQHRIKQEQDKQARIDNFRQKNLIEEEEEMEPAITAKVMPSSRETGRQAERPVIFQEEETPAIARRPRIKTDSFQMVSKNVTRPERKAVVTRAKSKLEDALIKRIAVNPRDIEAYERLGDYYIEQDNMADALECYRQVLRLSPVHYKAKSKIRRIERMLAK